MNSWTLAKTTAYETRRQWYEKKKPDELAAVLNNLKRYQHQLVSAKNSLLVQAGYIHPEKKGVIALDQRAGGSNLEATRLYLYAEETTKTVHLITIGNKETQPKDIKLSHSYVESLSKKTTT